MKKLITLLLSVCLLVTLMPALAFADESDDQQDAGQVLQMESQEDIVPDAGMTAPDEDVSQSVDPSEENPQDEYAPSLQVKGSDESGEKVLEIATENTTVTWSSDEFGWVVSIYCGVFA